MRAHLLEVHCLTGCRLGKRLHMYSTTFGGSGLLLRCRSGTFVHNTWTTSCSILRLALRSRIMPLRPQEAQSACHPHFCCTVPASDCSSQFFNERFQYAKAHPSRATCILLLAHVWRALCYSQVALGTRLLGPDSRNRKSRRAPVHLYRCPPQAGRLAGAGPSNASIWVTGAA